MCAGSPARAMGAVWVWKAGVACGYEGNEEERQKKTGLPRRGGRPGGGRRGERAGESPTPRSWPKWGSFRGRAPMGRGRSKPRSWGGCLGWPGAASPSSPGRRRRPPPWPHPWGACSGSPREKRGASAGTNILFGHQEHGPLGPDEQYQQRVRRGGCRHPEKRTGAGGAGTEGGRRRAKRETGHRSCLSVCRKSANTSDIMQEPRRVPSSVDDGRK